MKTLLQLCSRVTVQNKLLSVCNTSKALLISWMNARQLCAMYIYSYVQVYPPPIPIMTIVNEFWQMQQTTADINIACVDRTSIQEGESNTGNIVEWDMQICPPYI